MIDALEKDNISTVIHIESRCFLFFDTDIKEPKQNLSLTSMIS